MISKLFQFDFKDFLQEHPKLFGFLSSFVLLFVILSLIFTYFDLAADNATAFTNLITEKGVFLTELKFDASNRQHLFFISVAAIYFVYATIISLIDFLAIKRAGHMKRFLPVFLAHLGSSILILFILDFIFSIAQTPLKQLFHQLSVYAHQAGGNWSALATKLSTADAGLQNHTFVIDYIIAEINASINAIVPTLIYTTPFIAFLLTILVGSFFEYGVHWLDHRSRFLWLVNHRIHHTAAYMHPMGMGVVDVFPKLFVGIPKVILQSAISKLFYQNALFEYFLVFNIFYIFTQYFNHSTYYYEFFSKKPWLQALLFVPHANGTYHYVHHSALEGDDSVNLSAGGFMIWDRVFGTYRKPYTERPPVGLTGSPEIKLNPFSLVFSGWQQLIYEWRHNKGWQVRWKILFGSIWYMPPVTKDFLKK
jgi:sterol desaturase/sphingolipid hydroxylase (fatty acid hydroxylase superfamily)